MFLGRFLITFTNSNKPGNGSFRIVLPKKFRLELKKDTVYLIKGFDGGIWGFDQKIWEKESHKRLYEDLRVETGRLARRSFFSNADSVTLDDQGRIILPDELVKDGNLKDKLILIGAGDHFEIWNQADWQKLEVKEV